MALRLSEVEEIRCSNGQIFASWLRKLSFFAGKRVHVVENTDERFHIRIYTTRNCYGIIAVGDYIRRHNEPRIEGRKSYLGCIAATRTPRPGEDWTRGNDLPDGPFCKETFHSIFAAIVFYEALEVVQDVERIAEEKEIVE